MNKEQIFMGTAIAIVSIVGLWRSRWFIENTSKGRLLRELCGATHGRLLLQLLLTLFALLGFGLALDLVQPIQW